MLALQQSQFLCELDAGKLHALHDSVWNLGLKVAQRIAAGDSPTQRSQRPIDPIGRAHDCSRTADRHEDASTVG